VFALPSEAGEFSLDETMVVTELGQTFTITQYQAILEGRDPAAVVTGGSPP
jgi:hypothetical protein